MQYDIIQTTPHAGFAIYAGVLLFGYVLGSIPFGLLFTRLAGAGDVRKIGSGNIGATNVLRTGKKWAAIATLICDAGKGAIPVLLCASYFGPRFAALAGLGAFLGHIFPVWLKFKGGKGVATFVGISFALCWPAAIAVALTWIIVALVSRMSSLSALAAATLSPVYMYLFGLPVYALLFAVMALVIFYTHRENIARLSNGTEPRIGKSKAGN
ncbi:MAG TPA: glycerol-3-phosphate 1-O-acyltransferase PlsY [Rhizomicrobium sp.]|nr:glycerol-3-phosphate 1-O-acyltransferase PlsY [Rhizomicrobium sp.]